MRRIILVVLFLLYSVPHGRGEDGEIADHLPEGYPSLESWFGFSRSELIWNGYLFLEGRYVDAPYVVEQRGRDILVNGYIVTRAVHEDWRLFLGPYERPLHEQPPPPEIPEDVVSLGQILLHPTMLRMWQFWQTHNTPWQEMVERRNSLIEALPQVERVEEVESGSSQSSTIYRVTFRSGQSQSMEMGTGYGIVGFRRQPERHPYMSLILREWTRVRSILASGGSLRVRPGRISSIPALYDQIPGPHPGEGADDATRAMFEVLASDRTVEEKIRVLHRMGILRSESVTLGEMRFGHGLLSNFQFNEQFVRRLAGDRTWRDGLEELRGPVGVLLREPTFGGEGLPRPPPPPDRRALRRDEQEFLVTSASEPSWSGIVFVDGWYIDAPYVIERRGQEIRLNGYPCFHVRDDGNDFPPDAVARFATRINEALEAEFRHLEEALGSDALVVIEGNRIRLITEKIRLFTERLSLSDFGRFRHTAWIYDIDYGRGSPERILTFLKEYGLIDEGDEEIRGEWFVRFMTEPRFSPQFWRREAGDPNWRNPDRLE